MRTELDYLIKDGISDLFDDVNNWGSLLIDKYPPVIHRLYRKISDNRTVMLHRLFHSGDDPCLMHSHSWPFAIKIIDGGYEMGIGFSKDRNVTPPTISQMLIKEGDMYDMTSSDIWHYTKPLTNYESHSIMLVGNRWRERKAQNNDSLPEEVKLELFNYFKSKLTDDGNK